MMRFGLYVSNYGSYGDPLVLRDLAVSAESAGWDGFFMWDLITPDEYEPPVADPWVTLGAVAQATNTILIGPLVVPVPRRRPWKLALEAATLQALSGGRLILGVGAGAGWDYSRFGESNSRRELAGRLDEGTEVLHRLLSGEPVAHDGEYYGGIDTRFPRAEVPVWTSGFWPRKAPIRGVRNASGLFPQIRDPEQDFRLPSPSEVKEISAEFAEATGRAGGDIAIWSPLADPSGDQVKAYEEAGATWWFANGWDVPLEELRRRIAAGPPARDPQ